jgi:hypothetical protein
LADLITEFLPSPKKKSSYLLAFPYQISHLKDLGFLISGKVFFFSSPNPPSLPVARTDIEDENHPRFHFQPHTLFSFSDRADRHNPIPKSERNERRKKKPIPRVGKKKKGCFCVHNITVAYLEKSTSV